MIRYCRNCVYPETKPDLKLDDNGICDACRFVKVKDTTNWELRRKEIIVQESYFSDIKSKISRAVFYAQINC